MSRPPSRLPDDLPGPIFTVSEALEAGLRRGRLQSSDLIRLRRGLVARADRALTPADVCRAQMRTHEDTVAVGETAAQLWGMPLPSRVPDFPVRLSSPPNVRRRDDAIVSWSRRRIDQAAVIVVHGVRLLDRPATWASLGATLPLEDLVIIADHLLREPRPHYDSGRTTPYATRAQLAAAIDRSPRTGRPRLREALDRARVGADSPMETRLRLLLAREGLPEPVLNRPVLGVDGWPIRTFDRFPDGERGPTPDMQWPAQRVAVEYDGDHHLTREQKDRDVRRRERFRRLGWLDVVVTGRDMHHGGLAAARKVRSALWERGWRPTGEV